MQEYNLYHTQCIKTESLPFCPQIGEQRTDLWEKWENDAFELRGGAFNIDKNGKREVTKSWPEVQDRTVRTVF